MNSNDLINWDWDYFSRIKSIIGFIHIMHQLLRVFSLRMRFINRSDCVEFQNVYYNFCGVYKNVNEQNEVLKNGKKPPGQNKRGRPPSKPAKVDSDQDDQANGGDTSKMKAGEKGKANKKKVKRTKAKANKKSN